MAEADLTAFGQPAIDHADAVSEIVRSQGGSPGAQASPYLAAARSHLSKPDEALTQAFGPDLADLARSLEQLGSLPIQPLRLSTDGKTAGSAKIQTERARKMLLAFAQDMRAVVAHLSSRLEDLRWCARSKLPPPVELAREILDLHAPLAQRLGLSGIKWELEDLAFRFTDPEAYRSIAGKLDEKRSHRESDMSRLRDNLSSLLAAAGIPSDIQGRPKHILSIAKKMRGKGLAFEDVLDIRALRVIVDTPERCYEALDAIHSAYAPDLKAFDDYIAKPKPNGYQSIHTIVRDADGRAMEIQIRTQAMHDRAEHGGAAHWAYKEAGTKGYAGVTSTDPYDAKIAALRQLIDWRRDVDSESAGPAAPNLDDRIYAFTPDAQLVELPAGSTPIDFAYAVHTLLGHRCRGARVDGAMVALDTPLKTGQRVEIISAKEGGPSRDWLNPDLGFLASPRARAKAKAWLNTQTKEATSARGREAIEKALSREGKSSSSLDALATLLSFPSAGAMFEAAGKDELSMRSVEAALRPPATAVRPEPLLPFLAPATPAPPSPNGILVVGVDSLMTQLASCCKPAPPDPVAGFITRGRGVSIHRQHCKMLHHLASEHPERLIPVAWGAQPLASERYRADIFIRAQDRQGLLRDIGEACSKEKTNVVATQTKSDRGEARMTFTVEVASAKSLAQVLASICAVDGVLSAQRK